MVLFNKRINFILNTGHFIEIRIFFVVKISELIYNLFSSKSNYRSY